MSVDLEARLYTWLEKRNYEEISSDGDVSVFLRGAMEATVDFEKGTVTVVQTSYDYSQPKTMTVEEWIA